MNRADLHKRIAALARRYKPEEITFPDITICVVNVVPWTDSRCGTWQELDDNPAPFARSTEFFGRNLAHIDQLIEQHHAAEETTTRGSL